MPMAVAPFAFSSRQTRWPHGANRTVLNSTGEMSFIRRWGMEIPLSVTGNLLRGSPIWGRGQICY